jgi:hypothetical protein
MSRLWVVFGAVVALLGAPQLLAQPGGSSTITMTWGSGAAVPTLGTWGLLALAVLLAVVAFRLLRKEPALLRGLALIAASGALVVASLGGRELVAGAISTPIEASACQGSETYTANGAVPPPCFVNNCGAPVTVSYEFVSGQDGAGTPLTSETCTFSYFCEAANGGAMNGGNGATCCSSTVALTAATRGQPWMGCRCRRMGCPTAPPTARSSLTTRTAATTTAVVLARGPAFPRPAGLAVSLPGCSAPRLA